MHRRDFILTGLAAAWGLWSQNAEASLALAMSLSELVDESTQIWVGTAREAHCEWQETKAGRHIVTYTRVQRETLVTATESESNEVWVRTLGGHVGRIGQLVHGEADLRIGERNVVFMSRSGSDYLVTGKAQGQFHVDEPKKGNRVLAASRNLPHLARAERSAAKKLSGLEFLQALREIQAVKP